MKYKALKDVPYWGIKAGEVYYTDNSRPVNAYVYNMVEPLLEAGIIKEHKTSEPLTKENIKYNEKYLHIYLLDNDLFGNTQWDKDDTDKRLSRAPIFRTDEEKVATDCYKAMCDFGFEWVKENYSKYH